MTEKSRLVNNYERTPSRLDGIDMQDHYRKVAKRVGKFHRRLMLVGFSFDVTDGIYVRGQNRVTLEYVEEVCDFTSKEFNIKYYGILR